MTPVLRRRIIAIVLSVMMGAVLLIIGWWAVPVISRPIGVAVIALGVIMLIIPVAQTLLLLRGTTQRDHDTDPTTHCQRCGYDMTALPKKRCPECGALTGFTKSAEELGIAEDEIRS